MKEIIDARGLACPQPVVLTRNKMKDASEIEVIVDNDTAFENIGRLAASAGYSLTYEKKEDNYHICLTRGESTESLPKPEEFIPSCSTGGTVVVIPSDTMGNGDDELGRILMKAFLNTLTKIETLPSKVVFYNTGVRVAAEGSGSDDDIAFLESKGVELLICGTCVNYFELKERIKSGTISNMFDILTSLNNAAKVIRP